MQFDQTRPAPDIRLRTCTGEEFQLSDLRSKQPVVLIFIGDALTEAVQARLADFAAQRAAFAKWSTAVVVVALPSVSCESLDDWPYPVLLDEDGEAHRLYLPDPSFAIFVLDRYTAPLAVETPGDAYISASEAVEDIRLSELSCAI